MSPNFGYQTSVTTTIRLGTSTGRRLQTTTNVANDMSTDAFRAEMMASVIHNLPRGFSEADIALEIDSAARTVVITISHITETGFTAAAMKDFVDTTSFTSSIATSIGLSVEVVSRPNILFRIAAAPSPPPTPPSPDANLDLGTAQNLGHTDSGSSISHETIWAIIGVVVVVVLLIGCGCAYWRGKRSAKKMKEVEVKADEGAKAAARPSSSSDHAELGQPIAGVAASPVSGSIAADEQNAMRLIGLGVQLERQLSGNTYPPPLPLGLAQPAVGYSQPVPASDLAAALQNVQLSAANLSFAAGRELASADARASANLWLRESLAAASANSSPRTATPVDSGTPKGSVDLGDRV